MTLAKYVAVLGSYIHNCIFVFKLKRIFLKIFYAPPFCVFTECASCSVAHCQSPGVWLDYRSGGMVWHSCSVSVRLWWCVAFIASTRGLQLNTQDRDRGACLEGQLSFSLFFGLRYYFPSSWCPVDARQLRIMGSRRHLLSSHEDSGFSSTTLASAFSASTDFQVNRSKELPLPTLPWRSRGISKGGF